MSKEMKVNSIETVSKRLTEIKRRLRHISGSYSASFYDEQVFHSSAVEDMQFLLNLVKKLQGESK